jgi:hypothetical protein
MREMQGKEHEGSGKPVADFGTYCEGDLEPTLNKRINALIDCTNDYIVYLDDDLYVEWSFTHDHGDSPDGFDEVANRIGHLETLSITQLSRDQREPFARLLAEAMARILGDRDEGKAEAVLDKAEAYLKARGTENARRWYLQGSGIVALMALAVAAMLLLIRSRVANPGWLGALDIMIGTAMGSLGALISIGSRAESIHLEPVAGPKIHKFEGMVRLMAGMAGAFFAALAIKADLLLGVFQSLSHPFLALIVACIVSGASERLVPGLIRKMGKAVDTNSG